MAPAPTPAPVAKPSATPEARAEKLGFARYLPASTEQVVTVFEGAKSVEKVKASKLWQEITDLEDDVPTEAEGATAPEEEEKPDVSTPDNPEKSQGSEEEEEEEEITESPAASPAGPAELFSREVTMAFGKSTGEQVANLMALNEASSRHQMRSMVKMLSNAVTSGDMSGMAESTMGIGLVKDILADPQGGIAAIEKFQLPPVFLALRAPDGQVQAAAEQVAGMVSSVGMIGPMAEPAEKETAGAKFKGFKIIGAKIAETMASSRESLESVMDSASADKVIAAIAKKDFFILSGSIGEYAVVYLGPSIDGLELAAKPGDSLLAEKSAGFYDQYLSKDLAFLAHGSKASNEAIKNSSRTFGPMADGLREGLAEANNLGDTTKLQSLLKDLADKEKTLLALAHAGDHDIIAWHEDGLRAECLSGNDYGMIDWKGPNKLAALGDNTDVAIFANFTMDEKFETKSTEFTKTLVETAYEGALKASELNISDEDFAKFKQGFQLFNTEFRSDAFALASIFTGELREGLGLETALVVDFTGTAPALPNLPKDVIDNARIPRVTAISPVKDRTKLAQAWEKTNTATTNMLAKAGKLTGKELPMQKPMSTEKDGFTTWFFAVPIFNDDFVPSVTLNDKWFAMSTSKLQALSLLNKAATSNSSDNGLTFRVNFAKIQDFCKTNLAVAEKNAAELGMSPADLAKARKTISAMDELDSFLLRAQAEGDAIRSSLHFKTR